MHFELLLDSHRDEEYPSSTQSSDISHGVSAEAIRDERQQWNAHSFATRDCPKTLGSISSSQEANGFLSWPGRT
jgi:hypothetical protein